MTLDHYLLSMIIEALLANGVRSATELDIIAQQHMPSIRRIFIESGLDQEPMSDSLYEQLLDLTTDYLSVVLTPYNPMSGREASVNGGDI